MSILPSETGTDPRISAALLRQLIAVGFSNREFGIIHHSPGATIGAHLAYCERVEAFRPESTNARVQLRLAFILRAYNEGGFAPYGTAKPGVLHGLALAAVEHIPICTP